MKGIILPLAAIVFVTGCAGMKTVPMDVDAVQASTPKTVVVSQRETASFVAMTPSRGMLGALGGIAMVSEGNKLVEEYRIEDPANYIGHEIVSSMRSHLALEPVNNTSTMADTKNIAELSSIYGDSDLLVDVQTGAWNFSYFPTNFKKYRVLYNVQLRIIDTRSESQVAGASCKRQLGEQETAPTYDELIANNAEHLKALLRQAADECIEEFRETVINV